MASSTVKAKVAIGRAARRATSAEVHLYAAPPDHDEIKFLNDLWKAARFLTGDPAGLPAPFATRGFDLPSGPHELACWLPGPHPRHAVWWEELSVWCALRPVTPLRFWPDASPSRPRADRRIDS